MVCYPQDLAGRVETVLCNILTDDCQSTITIVHIITKHTALKIPGRVRNMYVE